MKKHLRLLSLVAGLALIATIAWWRRAAPAPAGHKGWKTPVTNVAVANIEAEVAEEWKTPTVSSARKARSRAHEAETAGRLNEALDYFAQASALDPDDLDSRLARIRLLLRLARAQEADEALITALQRSPEDPAVLELSVQAALDQTNYERAAGTLEKLLTSSRSTTNTWLLAVELEARQGRFEAAAGRLAEGLAKFPTEPALINAVIELHERFDRVPGLRDYAETLTVKAPATANRLSALISLTEARLGLVTNGPAPALAQAQLDNADSGLLVATADTASRSRHLATAEWLTEQAVKAAPESAQAWWARARVEFARGNIEAGQAAFKRAYLLDPFVDPQVKYTELRRSGNFPFAEGFEFLRDLMATAAQERRKDRWFINVYRAKLALYQSDYDRAYGWLTESVKQRPNALAYTGLAQLHFYNLRADLGFEHLAIALQLDPTCSEAWAVKGNVLEQRRDLEGARRCFNEAVLHDPEHYALTYRLDLADRLKAWQQGVDDVTGLIARRPSARAALLEVRAQMLWRWNKPFEALRDLDEAVRLAPMRLATRGFFAMALQQNGRYADAIRESDWVLSREPQDVNALIARGHILREQGRHEEALAVADQLERSSPSRSPALTLRGLVHLDTGEFEKAVGLLEVAANDVKDDGAREWRSRAQYLSGDPFKADEGLTGLIARQRWIGGRSPYWALYRYLCLLKMGQAKEAAELIELYRIGGNQCNWPVPLIRYLNGELPEEIVLAKAAQEAVANQEKLERLPRFSAGHEITAHLIMGHHERAFGNATRAREHFEWVLANRHPLFMVEYQEARRELDDASWSLTFPPSARRSEPIQKGPAGAQSPGTGLLAWLPMTDDLNDHGPDRLPVNPTGNVRVVGGAAIFPGQGSHLELPHISLKHREFAVSLWLNVTGDKMMYSLVDQAGMDRCWQHLQIHLRADLQPFLGFYVDDLIAPSSLPSRGGWHHLVLQYVNHRQQIWLDGRLLAERVSPPLESREAPTYVGRSPGWESLYDFEGMMRDLRIYSRPLGAGEIGKLADREALLADLARRGGALDANSRALLATTKTEIDATAVDARPMLSMAGNRLTITGPPVQLYELQATLDLSQRWDVVQLLTNTTGRVEYFDADALHQGERFFRVRLIDYQPAARTSAP